MRTPSKEHLAAKAFFRDLMDLCGGPKRCSRLTGHPDSHLSAAGSVHYEDRWPRIDHVIDLESECGNPVLTRFLADLQGFDLEPRDGRLSSDLPHTIAAMFKEIADVITTVSASQADGRVDIVERAAIIKEAQDAIAKLQDLIVVLRGHA